MKPIRELINPDPLDSGGIYDQMWPGVSMGILDKVQNETWDKDVFIDE